MDKIASINIKSIVAKINDMVEVISLMLGKHDELARAQGELKKEVDAIEIPKPQSLESILKRIKTLEEKPEPPRVEKYDDSDLFDKLAEIEKSIESLDKRLDFVKRTYSEKWSSIQFDRVSDDKIITGKFDAIESKIESIRKSACDVTK